MNSTSTIATARRASFLTALAAVALLFAAMLRPALADGVAAAAEPCGPGPVPAGASTVTSRAMTVLRSPAQLPAGYTGCRRIWLEDGRHFLTESYEAGQLAWARGKEPKGKPFRCLYRQGELDRKASSAACAATAFPDA